MRPLALLIFGACLVSVSLAVGAPTPAKPGPAAPKQQPAAGKGGAANAPAKPKVVAMTAGWAPPAYLAMVKKWHEKAPSPPVDGTGRPKLVLSSINGMGRVELTPLTDKGGFSPLDIDRVTHALRSSDGSEHPIDPRLLDAAYALQRHFHAGEVRFLSGYRKPKRLGSNHGYGRALDLVVPGATDHEVAEFARAMGFVGVGIYPTSGFVHLDVRDRSFFWVDRSGPGKPNKTVGILRGDAAASDVVARKAGHFGTPSPAIGRDVNAALAARAKAMTSALPTVPVVDSDDSFDDDH